MPRFRCKMNTPDGRVVEKILIGQSKSLLREHLEKEGHFVIEIQGADGLASLLSGENRGRKIKLKNLLIFNQEFSVLIRAGLPVVAALNIIIEKSGRDEITHVLSDIRNEINGGASLSEAFGKYSHLFSTLYVSSLKAGEKSGNIASSILRYIEYIKKVAEIRKKIIAASVYPLILTLVSISAILFLLVYVVPSFTSAYMQADTQLPRLTLFLVGFSNTIKGNFLYFLLLLGMLTVGYKSYQRTESGRAALDKLKLQIPFLGSIYIHYSLSRMARTLATVIHGGMPLLDSLRISIGALDNQFLKQRLLEASEEIEKGMGFTESISKTGAFPKLALGMLEAGEKSGALEQVLNDISDFYDGEIDESLSVLTSSIEPVLMVVMGLIVGFIILAMYMPIFQMASTIR
ncbi:MAG: type II secretion system F family protein [Deltaproteobacteria bacterium]|nr:type II secretion system F family protein [Deltaproteobacteria bacterium]